MGPFAPKAGLGMENSTAIGNGFGWTAPACVQEALVLTDKLVTGPLTIVRVMCTKLRQCRSQDRLRAQKAGQRQLANRSSATALDKAPKHDAGARRAQLGRWASPRTAYKYRDRFKATALRLSHCPVAHRASREDLRQPGAQLLRRFLQPGPATLCPRPAFTDTRHYGDPDMTTDEQAIRDLVARWHAATARGDVDTVLALMSEDAVFLVPGKPPMSGRGAFEKGLRSVLTTHRIESTGEIKDIEISGTLAYCLTLLTVKMIPVGGGEANTRSGNTLTIFHRQMDGSWLLVRDANLLPAP